MERIHYAGDVVFTGTDISRALLSYARALAQDGSSATVEIPIYHEDGSHGTAEFLIGPASQVIADSIDSEWEELVDTKLVEELRAASRQLGGPRADPVSYAAETAEDLEFPDFGQV
jgi:hypothetical protein